MTAAARLKHRAGTHGCDGDFISDRRLCAAVLTKCPRCGIEGPTARLCDHERIDHKGEPPLPRHYRPEVPPRFKRVLDAMERRSGRTHGQMIEAALDAWLRGRVPYGYRKHVPKAAHWGETA